MKIALDIMSGDKAPMCNINGAIKYINNTLSRTIMTSLSTLIALFSLYFFGGQVIKPFAFTMIIGVIIGTYSSMFIAVPTLLLFKFRPQEDE